MFRPKHSVTFASLSPLGGLACLAVLLLSGCGKKDGIQSYTVPKPEAVALTNPPVPGSHPGMGEAAGLQTAAPEPIDGRMLGAIIPRGSRIWFLKMVGPTKAVDEQFEKFVTFIGTVKIDEGDDAKPSWTLPAGWTERPGDSIRYATIAVDSSDGPLELSVSALPGGSGDPNDMVLANVNRWRGQMGLPKTDKANLPGAPSPTEETHQRVINGMTVTLVNLVGKYQPGGMGAAPFASAPRTARPMAPERSVPQSGLKFQTPAGWQPGKPNMISVASFQVVDGAKKVEITVTGLSRSGLLENVNRWRGQIQLEPVTEQQLASLVVKVPVGSATGDFVELTGKGTTGQPESILGAIAENHDRLWFFKLKGDAELAGREKSHFLEFVKSVQFE